LFKALAIYYQTQILKNIHSREMKINLFYSNRIEGKGISKLLKNKGYQVNLGELNHKDSYNFKKEKLFMIDIGLLGQISKNQKKWLCESPYHVILLGDLYHFFCFFQFNCKPKGFICKQEDINPLYTSIKKLNNNKSYLSKRTKSFLKKNSFIKQRSLFGHNLNHYLTTTELKTMHEISIGKTTQQIAKEWNRSHHTINNHRKNIMEKLNLYGTFRLNKFCFLKKSSIKTLIAIRNNQDVLCQLIKNS
jgi:DNA-binding CsgD family transcriptional regulator